MMPGRFAQETQDSLPDKLKSDSSNIRVPAVYLS
jgi:hypothetical protein